MLDPINEEIKKLVESDSKYSSLANIKLNRTIVKRSLMTISYGVTVKGIYDGLMKEHFEFDYKAGSISFYKLKDSIDSIDCDVKLTAKDIYQLAKIIYNSLFKVHPDLELLVNYFDKFVELFNNLGLPITWLTPSGLLINQQYINFSKITLSTKVLGKSRKVNVNVPVKDSFVLNN